MYFILYRCIDHQATYGILPVWGSIRLNCTIYTLNDCQVHWGVDSPIRWGSAVVTCGQPISAFYVSPSPQWQNRNGRKRTGHMILA